MIDAFDADVLIYASVPGHPLGALVGSLLEQTSETAVRTGSVLLLPEVLTKPLREDDDVGLPRLLWFLGRLDLHPVDREVADLATSLGARHRLRAADAVHLATAVVSDADRFITNNRRDFRATIDEVLVVYPEDLPA